MNEIAQFIGVVAAGVVVFRAEPTINKMSTSTHWMVLVGYALICAGAIGQILQIFGGQVPTLAELALMAGAAVLLAFNRRDCTGREAPKTEPQKAP